MQPFSIPTDNLYKFWALSSLLFAIFLWGSLIYINQSQTDGIVKIANEIGRYSSEFDTLNNRYKAIDKTITKICSENNFKRIYSGYILFSFDSTSNNNKQYQKIVSHLENERIKLLNKKDEIHWKIVGLKCATEEFDSDLLIILDIILLTSGGACAFFSISGFRKWYSNSQRYLDIVLMREAKISKDKIAEHSRFIEEEIKKNL